MADSRLQKTHDDMSDVSEPHKTRSGKRKANVLGDVSSSKAAESPKATDPDIYQKNHEAESALKKRRTDAKQPEITAQDQPPQMPTENYAPAAAPVLLATPSALEIQLWQELSKERAAHERLKKWQSQQQGLTTRTANDLQATVKKLTDENALLKKSVAMYSQSQVASGQDVFHLLSRKRELEQRNQSLLMQNEKTRQALTAASQQLKTAGRQMEEDCKEKARLAEQVQQLGKEKARLAEQVQQLGQALAQLQKQTAWMGFLKSDNAEMPSSKGVPDHDDPKPDHPASTAFSFHDPVLTSSVADDDAADDV